MTRQFNIAGLGEVLWDLYEHDRYVGGAPANFAFHTHLCGGHAYLLSRIGDDDDGRALRRQLAQTGIDLTGLQTSFIKPTGTVQVRVDAAGQPSFLCSRDTAFDEMTCDDSWLSLALDLDAILFGTLAQREESSRRAIRSLLAQAHGAVKIFDVNLRGWNSSTQEIVEASLQLCRIIKINEAELKILQKAHHAEHLPAETFLRGLLRSFDIDLAAVTLGSRGCWLLTADQFVHHPGFKVNVVDTTGCGDAFAAGLVYQYMHEASLDAMADYANRIAAFVATQRGATPSWTFVDLNRVTLA